MRSQEIFHGAPAVPFLGTGVLVSIVVSACGETDPTANEPVPPGPEIVARPLDVGHGQSCGIDGDGRLWCWGLIRAANDPALPPRAEPVPAPVSGDVRFAAVAVGAHSCGLTEDGRAHCWGTNAEGELGTGGRAFHAEPEPVVGDHTFVEIDVGAGMSCALDERGTAWCWGTNSWSDLPGTFESPVPDSIGGPFESISVGEHHACAIGPEGGAWCWGATTSGRPGRIPRA